MLKATGLTKSFGNIKALDSVTFRLLPDESLGVVGHNGSGKSTLRLAIMRQINLDSGELSFNGINLFSQAPHRLKALGIAAIGQFTGLVQSLTVLENINMGCYCLKTWRDRLTPYGGSSVDGVLDSIKMNHVRDSQVAGLTFYEQRLIELARALISSPKLLILDEPTSGLTAFERRGMIEILRNVRSSVRSMLIIDHALSVIDELCDRAIVMEAGRNVGPRISMSVTSAKS